MPPAERSGARVPPASSLDVDLVVNVFERSYRSVLRDGFFPSIEAQNLRSFSRKVALINNVKDVADAVAKAESIRSRGDIDEYHLVSRCLDDALTATGLRRRELGRLVHYSDCALVAITIPGSDWLVYWDAEVRLERPTDWVGPAIGLLERDGRVLVANPAWQGLAEAGAAAGARDDLFELDYGFSDQLFLARRSDLRRPIYRWNCPASLRYPLAHVAPVFEQRVDAYMRWHRLLRATYLGAVYTHPEPAGATYRPRTVPERLRWWRNRAILRALGALRFRHPVLKVP